ncbi:MAG: lauroyl acyltransferase [Alphaproteobacteria bacterium]|nr:lauroyl acyltransferase [Alphaproteobacteria bacterium]
MADFRSFRYRLEELGLRTLIGGLRPLSLDASSNLGAKLMSRLGPLAGRPSQVALGNLMRVFPEDEAKRLLPAIWANLGRVVFEYPHLRRLADDPERIQIAGAENFDRVKSLGKGCVFVAAHLGNWELFPLVMDRLGGHILLLYRAPNNPHVRDLVQQLRPTKGVTYIAKSHVGMRDVMRHLSKGGYIGFLTDHRYSDTLPVDLLGGQARIAHTAALLARRFGAPIICTRMERISGAHFRATLAQPIEPQKGDATHDVLQVLTQQVASQFEVWIKERPEQWFWMQKLWAKTDNL